jgi:hypothetical protein
MSLESSAWARFVGSTDGMTTNIPLCPRCREKMRLSVVAPVMFAETVDHFTYACKECGTEEVRNLKR